MKSEADELPKLLLVTELSFPAKWCMPPHSHPDLNELVIVVGGQIEVEMRGQRVTGRVGHAQIYPQDVTHVEHNVGSGPLRLLYVAWVDKPHAELPEWPLFAIDASGRLQHVLRWMMELSPAATARDRETLKALLHALLHEYRRSADAPRDEMIAAVRNFVQDNLARPIDLNALAKAAFMSPFHFSRVFRATTGQTPMLFLRRARVEAARALISTSSLPLREIARRVGFADEIQLSRVFRKITGSTPGACRAKSRSGVASR
jgi:AraC-like DNA-binding protein/quercetin dioxygenase-like cupin family protein